MKCGQLAQGVFVLISCATLLIACGENMGVLDRFLGPGKGTPEYHYQQGYNAFYDESAGLPEAINQFSLAIDLNSEFEGAFYFRGMAYAFSKEYDLAINDFARVLELEPDSAGAEFWKSTAFSEKRHEDLSRQKQSATEDGDEVKEHIRRDLIENILAFIDGVDDYRSNLLFRDLQCKELSENQYVFMSWYFDYAKPDGFRVTQISSTEDLDKWVSLDNDTTRMVWFYTVEGERAPRALDIESFLHIGKYAELLNQIESEGLKVSFVDDGSFYFLQAKLGREIKLGNWSLVEFRRRLASSLFHLIGKVGDDGDTVEWYGVPTVGESVPPRSIGVDQDLSILGSSASVLLKLWIRADDFSLNKAQILIAGELENKQPISFEITQVFDDFNTGVRVLPPPEM